MKPFVRDAWELIVSNELPFASEDLSNATVSADALSCHPETAQTILARGGDDGERF